MPTLVTCILLQADAPNPNSFNVSLIWEAELINGLASLAMDLYSGGIAWYIRCLAEIAQIRLWVKIQPQEYTLDQVLKGTMIYKEKEPVTKSKCVTI